MDGKALRDAVLAGAADGPALATAAAPAASLPLGLSLADPARPASPGDRAVRAVAPAAIRRRGPRRPAAAVMVQEPAPVSTAPEASGLESAILLEVRAALRGAHPDDLSAAVGGAGRGSDGGPRPPSAIRGTLVQRGSRWFMA